MKSLALKTLPALLLLAFLIADTLPVYAAPSSAPGDRVHTREWNITIPAGSRYTGMTFAQTRFHLILKKPSHEYWTYFNNPLGTRPRANKLPNEMQGRNLRGITSIQNTFYTYQDHRNGPRLIIFNSSYTPGAGNSRITSVKTVDLPSGLNFGSITTDNNLIYILNSNAKRISAFNKDGSAAPEHNITLPSTNTYTGGLHYHSNAFYVTARNTDTSVTTINAYNKWGYLLPDKIIRPARKNLSPNIMASYQDHLYVLDNPEKHIFVYKLPALYNDTTHPPLNLHTETPLTYPGGSVKLIISPWKTLNYQDDYGIYVNPPSFRDYITAPGFGAIQYGAMQSPTRCVPTRSNRKSRVIPLQPTGTTIGMGVCELTNSIVKKTNLSTGVISTVPIQLVNISNNNKVVETYQLPLHPNDINLLVPLENIYPSTATHGQGTPGLTWPAKWKYPGGTQINHLRWVFNGPGTIGTITPHDNPHPSDCVTSNPNTNYSTTNFTVKGPAQIFWVCRAGIYQIGVYLWDSSATNEQNIIPERRIRNYIQKATSEHRSALNIGKGQGETALPVLDDPDLAIPFTPAPPGLIKNFRTFTDEIPSILHLTVESRNNDNTYKLVAAFTSVTGATRYEIRIDQPTADGTTRSVTTRPTENTESLEHTFTTLSTKGQLHIRIRAAADCPVTNFQACKIKRLTDTEEYSLPTGATAYTRWSLRYYAAIALLELPPHRQGETVDPSEQGRHPSIDLATQFGGMAGAIIGAPKDQSRNLGITMWAIFCLALAAKIYVKAWRLSGIESGLSPIGAAAATLSLVFTWSVLGYIFADLKGGTAVLPLAAILFIVIVKGWNTVKG